MGEFLLCLVQFHYGFESHREPPTVAGLRESASVRGFWWALAATDMASGGRGRCESPSPPSALSGPDRL